MKRRVILFSATLASLAVRTAGAGDAPDLAGFVLGSACLTCHAAGGAVARLEGREAAMLAEQLAGFRDGTRAGTVMPRLARGLDDIQVARIAAWLAAREVSR